MNDKPSFSLRVLDLNHIQPKEEKDIIKRLAEFGPL